MVDQITKAADRPVPGDGETKQNRLTGLGSLSGIAVGVAVGAAAGALRRLGVRPSVLVGGTAVGLAAMAATDLPLAATGVSDPRTWPISSWLSDLAPHLAYGLITYATLTRLDT